MFAALFVAMSPPALAAPGPFTLSTNGSLPNVAVDDKGTAHIVWVEGHIDPDGLANDVLRYCQIPSGGTACAVTASLTPPRGSSASSDSNGPKVLLGPAGQVVLLTHRCCEAVMLPDGTTITQPTFAYVSTDNGQNFTGPAATGATPNLAGTTDISGGAAFGPGDSTVSAISGGGGNLTYQAMKLGSPVGASAVLGDTTGHLTPYHGTVAMADPSTPIAAGDDLHDTYWWLWGGSGDPNDVRTWKPPVRITGETSPRLTSGPRGVFLLTQRQTPGGQQLVSRHFNGTSFDDPVPVSETGNPKFGDVFQDSGGTLHAVWVDGSGALRYATSSDGFSWPNLSVLAPNSFSIFNPRVSACGPNNGFAVWDDNNSNGAHGIVSARALGAANACISSAPFYDVRVQSIEITQGIQNDQQGQPSFGGPGDPQSQNYGANEPPVDAGAIAEEVSDSSPTAGGGPGAFAILAEQKPTLARVFVALPTPPPNGVLPGVNVELHGYSHGHELPGSPLMPVGGPASISRRDDFLDWVSAQHSPDGAFDFMLPADWTTAGDGHLTLKATVIPPGGFGSNVPASAVPGGLIQCRGCQSAHGTFTLNEIRFAHFGPFTIRPFALAYGPGTGPRDPATVFNRFSELVPLAPNDLVVTPYVGTVDMSGTEAAIAFDTASLAAKGLQLSAAGQYALVTQKYMDAMSEIEHANQVSGASTIGTMVAGVLADDKKFAGAAVRHLPYQLPYAIVTANRPLTSVAHELTHEIGRVHASPCTPGADVQRHENWPPDQRGDIHGIGMDLYSADANGRHPIIGPGVANTPSEIFDYMGYCAQNGPDAAGNPDPNSWISLWGWNEEAICLALYSSGNPRKPICSAGPLDSAGNAQAYDEDSGEPQSARDQSSTASATPEHALVVTASQLPSGVQISDLQPTDASLPGRGFASGYTAVALNAAGGVVGQAPLLANIVHGDPRAGEKLGASAMLLSGVVEAQGAVRMRILDQGTTVSERVASANAPIVKLRAPHGKRVKGNRIIVKWRAIDNDAGATLRTRVDYSADNGVHWTPVSLGPDRGRTVIERRSLVASRRARIRLVVDDGFNYTTAISKPFRVDPLPPLVRIFSLGKRPRLMSNATLTLTGEAIDGSLRSLRARSLRWYLGRRRLGSGDTLAVTSLPPGTKRITLVARDAHGLTGHASIVVQIKGLPPQFTRLRGPSSLSRKAHTLTLTVTASDPATLVVEGVGVHTTSIAVGRKARKVKIKVRSGPTSLALRLTLHARTGSTTLTATIPRR